MRYFNTAGPDKTGKYRVEAIDGKTITTVAG